MMLPELRVYSTDPDWIDVLRRHNVHDNVNFWRKDTRQVHLPKGSYFLFRPHSHSVAGRAVFREKLTMSIDRACERFGYGNGVVSFEALRRKVVDVLHLDGDNLTCLVLDDVEFLDLPYPQLPPTFKPNKNPKSYAIGSLPEIESRFLRSRKTLPQ
jgi:hypothetical protein